VEQVRAADFAPRHGLDAPRLVELMDWTTEEFEARLAGSAIRRIGHQRWQRNIAVALGNAPAGDAATIDCLRRHRDDASALVREHVEWALARHGAQ
jgi:epoxyqueuosine reductase